jgi:hypothetical protein
MATALRDSDVLRIGRYALRYDDLFRPPLRKSESGLETAIESKVVNGWSTSYACNPFRVSQERTARRRRVWVSVCLLLVVRESVRSERSVSVSMPDKQMLAMIFDEEPVGAGGK